MKNPIVLGFAPTAALHHCEERSKSKIRCSQSRHFAFFLDCFVVPPRNDAKRVKRGRDYLTLASYVTKNTNLMKRILLIIGALLFGLSMRAQSVTYTCRYWFDQNFAQAATTTFSDQTCQAELDVSSLSEGLHALHLHVMDTSMKWSAPQSYLFFKADAWENGMPNYVYHCWFDEDFANQQTDALGNGHLLLNVADLEDGMHTVHVLVEGTTLTFTQSYIFMKIAVEAPSAELQYICWFDQDYSTAQTGPLGNGLFELEVSDLPNGIHTVNVQLDNGTRTAPQCYLFYKQPLGGYGIARWEYWLNDDIANRQITNISPTVDTLDIISLLNVGHPALRSSCFHFHPNDDAPYINAKNQINFRFWDNEMHFIDKSAYYVDEQVQQDIVATVFERNTTETFAAPRDNQIQWYKLDAVVGDSLSFIASKACTMQLFAPSGEEVYSATASEAMVFGGCHAWEDGTYYLAVHDVTGSGETVSVTHQHIGKYVVLSYSPDRVGNRVGNRFLIDMIGNGFNYLENAILVRQNDTLYLDTILTATRSTTKLQFVITDDVANGKYDILVLFSDGEETEMLCYSQALELEEPDLGEKIVTITTPAQTANPYPVRVTVENTGNMDYVYVPFNIAFTNTDEIEQIDFVDFKPTMTREADSLGYSFAIATPNLLDMHIDGCMMFLYIRYLKAHESQSFTFNFTAPAHTRFDFYAWVGDGYEYNVEFDSLIYGSVNRADPETMNVINIGETAQEVSGYVNNPVVNSGGMVGNIWTKASVFIGEDIRMMLHDHNQAFLESLPMGDTENQNAIENSYLPTATGGEILTGEDVNGAHGWWPRLVDHLLMRQSQASDSPTPNPGTPCHVFLCHPGDPNDMHGYTSESGSHYMRQEIQNVQYEIEFENDTTLATAAAHTIIVRDTLDATKFDLNSLAARSVTIGDKRLELNGEQTFARTLDLRPEIYVIAQVNQDYDPTTGIIQWTIQSLDPMTMEPTTNPYQGVLPVNYYGNGVGFIDYSINLKQAFADGTEISNRAGIIFDQEDIIMTPTWTNTVDAVKPTSHIEEVTPMADSLNFVFVSQDNRSGVWYHSLYYRNDSTDMQWQVRKAQIFEDGFVLHLEDLLTTEYLVIAVDSAGNREDKDMVAEYIYTASGLHFVTEGNWSTASNWQEGTLPGADDVAFIDAPCQLDQNAEVAALAIADGKTLTVQSGKTLTVNGLLFNTSTEGLVIKDGAQLINASGNVAATLEKDIAAYSDSNPDAWYTIASPMDEMPIAGSSFATPEFDLYRFNESNFTNEEWENYKANLADFTTFEKGRGYLFANSNSFSPVFIGMLNNTDVTCSLTCTNRPNDPLSGFNLIGNPFPHNIYKGSGAAIDNANLASGYYTLTNEGTWQVHTFEDAIHPGQGVLVKATAPTILTIAKSTAIATAETGGAKRETSPISISVKGEDGQDQAFVYFGRGNSMEKMGGFVVQEPSLWVRDNGKDYAIAHVGKVDETVELCFGTKQMGDFTLTVDRNETEFEYLQLVDHVTGLSVDLLKQSTYVFHATGQEPDARFSIRFKVTE